MGNWGFGWFLSEEIARWEAFLKLCTTKKQKEQVEKHIAELKAKRED